MRSIGRSCGASMRSKKYVPVTHQSHQHTGQYPQEVEYIRRQGRETQVGFTMNLMAIDIHEFSHVDTDIPPVSRGKLRRTTRRSMLSPSRQGRRFHDQPIFVNKISSISIPETTTANLYQTSTISLTNLPTNFWKFWVGHQKLEGFFFWIISEDFFWINLWGFFWELISEDFFGN